MDEPVDNPYEDLFEEFVSYVWWAIGAGLTILIGTVVVSCVFLRSAHAFESIDEPLLFPYGEPPLIITPRVDLEPRVLPEPILPVRPPDPSGLYYTYPAGEDFPSMTILPNGEGIYTYPGTPSITVLPDGRRVYSYPGRR